MSRRNEIPGLSFITCDWLQELGLWNTVECCPGCHEEHPIGVHGLYER